MWSFSVEVVEEWCKKLPVQTSRKYKACTSGFLTLLLCVSDSLQYVSIERHLLESIVDLGKCY